MSKTLNRPKIPICLFCYHKVGTELIAKVFTKICRVLGWSFIILRGKQMRIPIDADVVLYIHSLIDINKIISPFIGIHIKRDPRDVIISGYLYHRRTSEAWCINNDHQINGAIKFPKVPYSQEHRTEIWKANYLASLNGKSYQDNLLEMPQTEGIVFEMNNYGFWTIESMRRWPYGYPDILEIRFEDMMSDYEQMFEKIFTHLNFEHTVKRVANQIAREHDISRMTVEEVRILDHVSSIQTTRWKSYFDLTLKEKFIDRFDTVLIDLGYERDNSWSRSDIP